MINGQELFASSPHRPLCREQVFRGGFVGRERVRSDVSDWIDIAGLSQGSPNQTAAFARSVRECMVNYLVNMSL